MLFRYLAYLLLGWICLAAVPALGRSLELTLVLPSTSAAFLVHLAFSPEDEEAPEWGMAVALSLGYLEDLHQGAPFGVLCLAHGLSYVLLRQGARRFVLPGVVSRAAAIGLCALSVDLLSASIMLLLLEPLGLRGADLRHGLWLARWHVLASALAGPAVWMLIDLVWAKTGLQARLRPTKTVIRTAAGGNR